MKTIVEKQVIDKGYVLPWVILQQTTHLIIIPLIHYFEPMDC